MYPLLVLVGIAPLIMISGDRPFDSVMARQLAGASFPLGVFEDANIINGDTARFATLLEDLRNHQLDAVMLTNGSVDRDAPLLKVADAAELGVFLMPSTDLIDGWWSSDAPETSARAQAVVKPIVERLGANTSLKGYIIVDEPALDAKNGVALLTDAFSTLDPTRPAMPILIGIDRVGSLFAAARPAVLLIDVYPVGYYNPIGDFSMTGFGYPYIDFVNYIRLVTQNKPAETPLWIILQTHRLGTGGPFSLREPTPEEVRAQQWLAIGEGATGIFWFVYSSQQGWTGLADNPALFDEVKALAGRIQPLRDTLLDLEKVDDQFIVTGQGRPYVSTLASRDGRSLYLIVVNRDCQNPQQLSIDASQLRGELRDMESQQTYKLGELIELRPGDGRMFQFVGE